MSAPGQPPKRARRRGRKAGIWERISADSDVRRSARFLKVIGLGVVTMTLAFCMVGTGAYVIARVIHQIYGALEAHQVELPRWAHESEVQSVGAVLVVLIALAMVIALKDFWRVGILGEADELEEKPDSEHKP